MKVIFSACLVLPIVLTFTQSSEALDKYLIVFQNGLLDLKTLFFRPNIYSTDYISKCLPFDWVEPTQHQKDWVNKELKKICNWNDKHVAYYKSIFGYALSGDANKLQNFFYLKGEKASNGKSTILEALEKSSDEYFNINNFEGFEFASETHFSIR
jgi:phage/plasmid-associated DNA primase